MLFEQDRVIVRLQQRVLREADIVACFLSGSFGRRREDAYSDLDVVLIFASERQRDEAWQKRQAFAQSVLPYVAVKSFDGQHIRPFFHIALYSNGAKVDFRYETQTALTPTMWDRDIRILKDSGGWAEQFQSAAVQAPLTQSRLSTAELIELDNRFWVMFWDVYRQVLRGDSDKPFTVYLRLLSFALPPLLTVLPPEEPARQQLLYAYFGPDSKKTAQHLSQLLTAYLAARSAIIRRFHLDFTGDHTFESAIQKLVQRTCP